MIHGTLHSSAVVGRLAKVPAYPGYAMPVFPLSVKLAFLAVVLTAGIPFVSLMLIPTGAANMDNPVAWAFFQPLHLMTEFFPYSLALPVASMAWLNVALLRLARANKAARKASALPTVL